MRTTPSLADILCVIVVIGAVLYLVTSGLTLMGLVLTILVVVLLILVIRWALGGARL